MRLLQTLGIPGIVGCGLLLFCVSFYFATIGPMRAQVDSIKSEAHKLAGTLHTSESSGISRTASIAPALPDGINPASDPIEIIRRLNAAAENAAVTVDRASYTTGERDGHRRIEVTLPTKGGYLPIRRYLREALTVGRDPQIDKLALQRSRATDPLLDAELTLSFEMDGK